ncbi:MAG: DUF4386 domain-containing protein [marine benthic group bacterium]|nr:DUF4386 domain-containing protein [Gemmatimonadota bacterium]
MVDRAFVPPNTENSPIVYARVAGALYLVIIILGLSSELLVRGGLIVWGDAAATAASISASPGVFRLGFVADSVMVICDVALAVLMFALLKPVNATLALIAMVFRLTQTAVLALNLLNYYAALLLLEGTGFAAAFDPAQLQSLSYLFLDLHAHGYDLGLLLFGVHCLLLGYLIIRARYFPKAIGIMVAAGGLVYLLGSFARFLAPGYGSALVPLYTVPLVAELSLCLWLLFRGVDLEQWRAVAAGS